MTIRKIISVLVPLFIAGVLFPIVYLWENPDVRGWWPFMAFFLTLLVLAYTGLFFLIEIIRTSSEKYIYWYNIFVAGTYIGVTIFCDYVTKSIDWLAYNESRLELSLLQKLASGDYVFLWLTSLFLTVHAGIVLYKKIYSKTEDSTHSGEIRFPKKFVYYSLIMITVGVSAFLYFFL